MGYTGSMWSGMRLRAVSTEGIINMLKFRDDGPHGVYVVGYEAQVGVYTEGIIMLKVRDNGLYWVHTVGYEAQVGVYTEGIINLKVRDDGLYRVHTVGYETRVGVYRGYCVKAQRRWAIPVHAVGC